MRQNILVALCLLILNTAGFTSFSNNHHQVPLVSGAQQLKFQPEIVRINPILATDIQFIDITKSFANPSTAAQISAGNGGNYILVNFMNLLYSEFLNPLAKTNPNLHIPPEASDPEAFFMANGIETQKGFLQNHDGDSISVSWTDNAPSYPTTLAIISLFNILVLPLDQTSEFKQLAAKNANSAFNPTNGFFAQFINYILTKQLNAMLGWNSYSEGYNGTNLNTGMFDFDAGFKYYVDRNWPLAYYTIDSGHDSSNIAYEGLSSQINNFMFLLDSYVNFAAGLLNNIKTIIANPVGQEIILNNLVILGAFHTPKLFDTAAGADGRGVTYDDQDGGAATIFTAFPRFMINASYGDGPSHGQTREWGRNDNHYMLLLHYNGLISGYLWGQVEHHDFVHSSPQNTGHYYAYTDTTALNNLTTEKQIIGQMLYLRAWNSEISYLSINDPKIYNAICLNNWPGNASDNNLSTIDNNALLIQPGDEVNGFFSIQSLIKKLQKTFNPFITSKIVPFQQQFISLLNIYSQFNYGFKVDQNNNPIKNPYVDLTTLFLLTPKTIYPHVPEAHAFKNEQTAILTARALEIHDLYQTINLGFTKHINSDPLQYAFPNLKKDDPALHGCVNIAALYTFYADHRPNPTSHQYFNDFKTEQLAIQKEHQNTPPPKNQFHFPLWAMILIISSAVVGLSSMIIYFVQRTRRAIQPITFKTPK